MQPTSCHLLRKRLISSSAGKTRQRLLDAAAETLNRRGIQGATTREIARLAGSRSHPFPPFQKQRAASPRHSQARADHAIRSPVHDARRAGTLKREHTPHSAKRVITTFIVALSFAFAVIVGLVYMINSAAYQSTDDAFIDGHIVPVSAQVAGRVQSVYVDDNQSVSKARLVVELDPRDFDAVVRQKTAALASS